MIANIAAALTWVFVGPTLAQVELEQFIPETVLLSDLNVVGVFPEPITKVHCAARCTMMPDRACNIFYTTDDDCNLGKVDFIHQPPPIGSTVVAKVSSGVIRSTRCHSDQPCGLGGGPCFEDSDCRTGLVCTDGLCEACGIVGLTQSSAHGGDTARYGASFAMDSMTRGYAGTVPSLDHSVTDTESNPWWQVEYSCQVEVATVILANTPTRDNWNDYGVYVSDSSAVTGSLPTADKLCGTLSGPSYEGRQVEVICQQTLLGTHVIFQNRNTVADFLQLNEINIFGPDVGTSIQDSAVDVTYSTIHSDTSTYALSNGFNKNIMDMTTTTPEDYGWFQWEFANEVTVVRFIMSMRDDCCGNFFSDIGFHVGNEPAVVGEINSNPLCLLYQGATVTHQQLVINCGAALKGKYVILQKHTVSSASFYDLSFNEIIIHGFL